MADDVKPREQNQAQATIQQIIDRMGPEYAGADVEQVRAVLARAIADAGLPEQPEKFVLDAAAEISAGRSLVMDRRVRDEDDPRRSG
jgi:hypothetical protein